MELATVDPHGHLGNVLPATRAKLLELADAAAELGITFDVPEDGGLRTAARQLQLLKWEQEEVAAGGEPYAVASVGKGKHPVGGAFDVHLTGHNEDSDDAAYRKLADAGRELGLTAGFYFHARSDPYHFELGDSRDELAVAYAAYTRGSLPGGGSGDRRGVVGV